MRKVFRANLFAMVLILMQIIGGLTVPVFFEKYNLGLYPRIFLTQILFLVVPVIIYFIITRESIVETLRLKSLGLNNFLIIVAIGFLVQPVVMFLSAVTSLFFPNAVSEILQGSEGMSLGLSIAAIAVTPAICEEIVMRGVVLSGYKNVSIKKAAIMTGLIFCILHMNLQQSLYTFALGILLAYLVYITKSIFASMICHFIINASQVTLAFLVIKAQTALPEVSNAEALDTLTFGVKLFMVGFMFILGAGFAVAVFFLIKLLIKVNEGNINNIYNDTYRIEESNNEDIEIYKEKVFNWPIYVSIIVYILVNLLSYTKII